ncbi:NADPH:quinone oxidoreductase family protein [Cellulomonas fengjieae]|uniref:NADPH:quinone oxidoreductase family protein n=1 Tax=Cellulomonas fengjieae TaxID=2819978 RepID=A0ABS3SD22_9CELL|nr:NADPH:quinone oxidoreductase family protein [Cellulomonas fengjieae]MBO3083652.1 NADPH:quinone oxidoreductase family protein [Cellulomonas fengjieae]QVI65037.1 NADPH:quinone oxidoreductase family protein [Cellulomonas fengjieae]
MRAWQVVRHGEPAEVLELVDVADPSPGPGQVLVRVRAVAVNFPDALLARGEYQVRPALPFSPGIELCGEVVGVGDGVARAAVGDRVVGSRIGVLSELAVLDEREVFPAPAGLDDAEAAALTIGYQTAWFGLHRRAALQPGETLLVHAAAGGVGTAAVQLGAAAGARVIGVVGSAAKAEVARAAGADVVVDRSVQDLVEVVKAETAGAGADVVFDPVGGDAFERSTRCIAFEGRIVVVGFAGGVIQDVRAGHALVKNYGVLGLHWALYAQRRPDLVDAAHAELTRLIEAGTIRPVVADVVAFEDAPAAVQRLADGATTGRLVVRVG